MLIETGVLETLVKLVEALDGGLALQAVKYYLDQEDRYTL